MTPPVYFFFGILGLVAGGAIVWLLTSQHPFETTEEPWLPPDPVEASFLAAELTKRGHPIDEETAAELLDLHLDYVEGRARENQARAREARLQAERAAMAEARTGEEPAAPNREASSAASHDPA